MNTENTLYRLLISWHYTNTGRCKLTVQECTYGNNESYTFMSSDRVMWGQEASSCIQRYLAKSATIQRFLNETCTAEERAKLADNNALSTLEGLFGAHGWKVAAAGFTQAGKTLYVRIIDKSNN